MKTTKALKTLRVGILVFFLTGLGMLTSNVLAQESSNEEKKGDFIRGATLWANACVRCHNMRDPNELTDKQWIPVVSHMRLRAGLTGQDARDILAFLQQSNASKDEK